MDSNWTIFHAGALGDLVLAIQLVLRLPRVREAGPLTLVSRIDPGDLSAATPSILRRSLDAVGFDWLFQDAPVASAPPNLVASVRGRRVISFLSSPDTAIAARLRLLAPAALYSVDPRPQPESPGHVTQQWENDLAAQGLRLDACVYRRRAGSGLVLPDQTIKRGRATLATVTGRSETIVIHVGSGGSAKCWSTAGFMAVTRELRRAGFGVVILLGPAELERWPPERCAAFRSEAPTIESPPPGELLSVIAAASAFLGNDSGPTHLAALLGVRAVALFGPTDPRHWRPLGADVDVIQGDVNADPVTWGIAPETVIAATIRGTHEDR